MFKDFLKRFLPMPYARTELRMQEIINEIKITQALASPDGAKVDVPLHLPDPANIWKSMSFSQSGEDRILLYCIWAHTNWNLGEIRYLDIGANYPIANSNTYLFYIAGARGVLVEPNEKFWGDIAEIRPGDTLLKCGAGYDERTELEYYDFGDYGEGRNTFEPSTLPESIRIAGQPKRIIKKPMMHINEIAEKYFSPNGPDILCIDAEGFDANLLRAFDYSRFKPFIIMAEDKSEEIASFMTSVGYIKFGSSISDSFYLNPKRIEKNRDWLGLD